MRSFKRKYRYTYYEYKCDICNTKKQYNIVIDNHLCDCNNKMEITAVDVFDVVLDSEMIDRNDYTPEEIEAWKNSPKVYTSLNDFLSLFGDIGTNIIVTDINESKLKEITNNYILAADEILDTPVEFKDPLVIEDINNGTTTKDTDKEPKTPMVDTPAPDNADILYCTVAIKRKIN